MIQVSIDSLRQQVKSTRGPQFRLPKRFSSATFDNFIVDSRFSRQAEAIEKIAQLLAMSEPPRPPLRWRRTKQSLTYRGVYLDGPPGIGKTHLLAAAFRGAPEPKLFATFDEFSAAAGTLGMRRLRHLVGAQRLVCIDEIDLRDPGNIMLLTSLVRAMLEGRPRILATANADPTTMDAGHSYADDFGRELGEIAGAFEVIQIDGVDWRENGEAAQLREDRGANDERVAKFDDSTLKAFLAETHPMYDAAWLDQIDRIEIDRLHPMADTDQALRFVRFIDRVYDRDVALSIAQLDQPFDVLLAPVRNDARFRLHFARCRSRLTELVETGELIPLRIGS